MGGWGSRVLNFLVKIHIQLFVLQTSSNVLKHISHKVRRSYLAIEKASSVLNGVSGVNCETASLATSTQSLSLLVLSQLALSARPSASSCRG